MVRWFWGSLAILLILCPGGHAQHPGSVGGGPVVELRPGEHYLRWAGTPSFVFGRNPVGKTTQAYLDHLDHLAKAGERLVRIHFTYSPPGEQAGKIDPGMLFAWDAILDRAEERGLGVVPVLGIWSDWNDGSRPGFAWHNWDKNPFNVGARRAGQEPRRVARRDTSASKLWLKRLRSWSGTGRPASASSRGSPSPRWT